MLANPLRNDRRASRRAVRHRRPCGAHSTFPPAGSGLRGAGEWGPRLLQRLLPRGTEESACLERGFPVPDPRPCARRAETSPPPPVVARSLPPSRRRPVVTEQAFLWVGTQHRDARSQQSCHRSRARAVLVHVPQIMKGEEALQVVDLVWGPQLVGPHRPPPCGAGGSSDSRGRGWNLCRVRPGEATRKGNHVVITLRTTGSPAGTRSPHVAHGQWGAAAKARATEARAAQVRTAHACSLRPPGLLRLAPRAEVLAEQRCFSQQPGASGATCN